MANQAPIVSLKWKREKLRKENDAKFDEYFDEHCKNLMNGVKIKTTTIDKIKTPPENSNHGGFDIITSSHFSSNERSHYSGSSFALYDGTVYSGTSID